MKRKSCESCGAENDLLMSHCAYCGSILEWIDVEEASEDLEELVIKTSQCIGKYEAMVSDYESDPNIFLSKPYVGVWSVTKGQIEAVLEIFFVEREGEGILEDLRGMDLVADGLLDSIDTLILATYLEEKTGIVLDITSDRAMAAMRSFAGLVALATDQATSDNKSALG